MDAQEREALLTRAEEFIKSFESPAAAAAYFGKAENTILKWLKLRRFPQAVFNAINQPPAPPSGSEPLANEDYVTATQDRVESESNAEAKIQNLHERLQYLEELCATLSEQQDDVQQQIVQFALAGSSLSDNSGVRPGHSTRAVPPRGPRTAENSVVVGSRIVSRDGGGPGAVGSGMAPTREEANGSRNSGTGRLAGPAEHRPQIKPGDPGWNPDWNTLKPKVMMVPASSWPVSR